MKTKYIELEIPEDIKGFTVTFLYVGADGEMHMASRDYAPSDCNVYPLPFVDSMCLKKSELEGN